LQPEEMLRRATASEDDPNPTPRALLVVAHPDDEVVSLGARLARFGNAHFVHVTDGAPRNEQDSRAHGFQTLDAYRRARAEELDRSFRVAGIPHVSRESLGIPDQEASLHLFELTEKVLERLRQHEPEVVFTHPFEGGHPDHDACAFAVHHAVHAARTLSSPVIIEGGFYNARSAAVGPGTFLPDPQSRLEISYELTPDEQQHKRERIACYATQRQTLSGFSHLYERFRIAPEYDFRRPPHDGTVLYERYSWGMTAARFSELAAEAEAQVAELDKRSAEVAERTEEPGGAGR
jgi:N-acetylglucosamine malate deacetylase 2